MDLQRSVLRFETGVLNQEIFTQRMRNCRELYWDFLLVMFSEYLS